MEYYLLITISALLFALQFLSQQKFEKKPEQDLFREYLSLCTKE